VEIHLPQPFYCRVQSPATGDCLDLLHELRHAAVLWQKEGDGDFAGKWGHFCGENEKKTLWL
jgi:hypothetical protein